MSILNHQIVNTPTFAIVKKVAATRVLVSHSKDKSTNSSWYTAEINYYGSGLAWIEVGMGKFFFDLKTRMGVEDPRTPINVPFYYECKESNSVMKKDKYGCIHNIMSPEYARARGYDMSEYRKLVSDPYYNTRLIESVK